MLRCCVVVLGVWCLAACTKHAPEYYQFEAEYSNLVSRESDEAYLDEEMDNILTRLRGVNPDAKEGPLASALVEKIERERARVKQERADAADAGPRAAAAAAPPEFLPTPALAAPTDAGAALDAGVADAGVRMPYAGMPEAEFLKSFGDCVEAGPPAKVPLATSPGTTQVLKKDEGCEKRLMAEGGTRSYVFIDGRLAGQVDRTVTQVTAPAPPPPKAPAAEPEDAGERLIMRIPGAPTEGAPPPPAQ